MITLGLPLLSTLDELEQDEVYLAYTAAVSGSDRLYLTWCGTDLKGEGKTPSPLIQAVRKILPETAVRARDAMAKEDEARTGETAFTLLAREYRTDSLLSATLTQLFREEPDYTHRLAALDRAASGKGRQFDNPAKARQLFPDTLRLSATQIEAYHQCPFQYFCKYGLRAKEQRPAELSPLEYGNLIHYLLETMFGQVGHAAICQMTDDALREAIRQAIGQFLLEQLGGADDKTPRFLHLFQRMAESATIVIRHIAKELAQSAFQPLGYEMTVDRDGDFPPLTVPLSNGGTAVVGGIIDRVDLYEENGVQYLRVVDYKTGRKKFQLADVVNGVNLQMLLYLAALIETGKYQPAGVLYMPASRPVVSAEKGMGKQEIEKAAEKKLQMNGLLLDDPLILTAMEQDGAGQFIPATIKDGKVRSTATVTKAELDSVLRYMKRTVGEMAQSLHQGQVEASPLQGSYDGCAYCPYFPVCCHEKDDGGRMGLRLDKKEALAAMNPGAGEEEPDYAMDNGTAERH